MNPSYTAISDGPWGIAVPDHLPSNTELEPAPSPDPDQQDFEGPVECQSCGKQYTRLCDLNKHLKTHSRPFKCPIEECRYYTFGWPTEKELNRHYNDKHSTEPSTYSCLWHDCNYTSKRESNCKQHMEKAHGYNYIRTRAGNKEDDPHTSLGSPGHVSPQLVYPRSKLGLRSVPDVLLTPSPLEQCLLVPPDASSPMGLNGPMPYGPGVYTPWNSPVTRLRNNEPFLEDFSQTYGPGTPVAVQDSEWLSVPVNPGLCNPGSSGINNPEGTSVAQVPSSRDEMFKALPTIAAPGTSPTVTSQVLTPVSEPSPTLTQGTGFKTESATPRDADSPREQRQAESKGLGASHTGHLEPSGKRHVSFVKRREDDSDGDDEPPVKRIKGPGGSDEDVGDPRMICPFRKAHPEIYDLNVHTKYSSCHTEHNNISTVVRHLGRPAHRLEVDTARHAISSFNVTDNEYGHPAAGLCKKCWRVFTDREAFENHFWTKCETASRSKREKFQILLDTFCGTRGAEHLEDAEGDVDDDAPASATGSRLRDEDVVRRSEYLALVERVATLERMLSPRMPLSATPRTLPGQQPADTVARAFTSSPALPSQAFGYYSYDSGPGPSRAAGGGGGDPRTTTVVVGGMGSRPIPVARDRSVGGFHSDNERVVTSYRSSLPRRPDSASTVRRASPLTVAGQGPATTQQQRGGHEAGGGTYAAAGNPAHVPVSGHRVEPFGAGDSQTSQQSTNTMMRDRWEQAVQAGDEMMERMDFFNSGSSGDDISKFLNMDSQ